ncbi:DUF6220 domain-containing protein [Glaciibacter superstes]|uniref:DUF6220 domain-containing protein n=1 Tax=Glaciibacter superstes TaxID=501023 RepID=UPI0003B63672|nr:DUF6220 domain-containing protein [Glaciibacter superstes]
MRKVFAVVTTLLTVAVVLQFYFAAMGVFSLPEEELFAIHGTNGRVVVALLALLTLIAALLARAGKNTIWLSVLPLVLVLFQTVLFIITSSIFNVSEESAEIPIGATIMLGFHGLNGVAILWISAVLTKRAWRLASGRPATDRAPRERDSIATEPVSRDTVSDPVATGPLTTDTEAPPRVAGAGRPTSTGTATGTPTIVP